MSDPYEHDPEAVPTQLAELQTLATKAVAAWRAGDRHGATEAATAAVPASAAALSALNVLLELDRARAESDRASQNQGTAGQWLG
ncbi:hypothetical protein [Kitasatospora sp. NPDC059571]|uniref:hypothetical protein n=1 Tax=Kitasatospora sp. NPDC059571 TaxID=3346871 RepID=UPI0036A80685